jgi:hypothetical protein
MSSVSKGNYYKQKTKEWLLSQGYEVAPLETLKRIWSPNGIIYQKHDLFGADLLAISKKHILFVQSKALVGQLTNGIPKAKALFDSFNFPNTKFCQLWIAIWLPRKPYFILHYKSGSKWKQKNINIK